MPWVPVIGSRFRSTKLKYLVSNISRTSLWYSPIHAYFVNFHTILWSRDFYLHFRDKENTTEKLSKLPHVPQLETGSQVVWFYFSSPSTIILRNPGIHWTIKWDDHLSHQPREDAPWEWKNHGNKLSWLCPGQSWKKITLVLSLDLSSKRACLQVPHNLNHSVRNLYFWISLCVCNS